MTSSEQTPELKNSIGGPVRRLEPEQLLAQVSPELRDRARELLSRAHGMVCYEVLDLGSPRIGHRKFMIFGAGQTHKTLDECVAGHLGSSPSDFHYPVSYCLNPGAEPSP